MSEKVREYDVTLALIAIGWLAKKIWGSYVTLSFDEIIKHYLKTPNNSKEDEL